ncbi:TonB-dependent receptor domain-containing protein [Anianabacter salinae]|uniref:TonB-dependent receptor domain-containing protein n=1 Tax=Anianabacter salinae TaxID=2851023 RepID=UPI00225DE94E|nr:TonB-dependent receptor [Anianabacter salinae]MBV0912464.1 TonB-dependent receptor [Anianabacter salinae]
MQRFSSRAALCGGTAVTAVLLAVPALSQDAGDGFLGTVVIGQSKRDVQTQTATPVTEIDQREIDDRQGSTIAELVDSVPGVNLVNGSTPQGSGINIRGFGANSTFGTDQKVAVQVDGASVGSEELYRIGTQLFTDPTLYREIEVIRGTVGSFEYGSGIIGGVVRLETIDASDLTGGVPGFAVRPTLGYSSNGAGFVGGATLAWQPTQRMEFLANYTYRSQSNQTDGTGAVIGNSAFQLPSYLLKARYSFGTNAEHAVGFSYTSTTASDRDVPYDTFLTTDATFGNVDRFTKSDTAALTYEFTPVGNPLVDLEVNLSFANQEIEQHYIPGSSSCEGGPPFPCGFPFPAGGFAVVNADQRFQTTKLTFKNTARFATGGVEHSLRAGIELIHRDRLDANSAPGGYDNRFAVFAIDEMQITPSLTLTPALRYETSTVVGSTAPNNGTFTNDALMGGLSARYAFGNGFAVFGSYAYTEGLPIIDDLNSAALMQQSEKAETYEIGASFARDSLFTGGDRFAIKANLYHATLWDITSYTVAGSTTQRPNSVQTKGVELEASYALETGYYADLNANIASGAEFQPSGTIVDWRGVPANNVQLTLGRRFGETLDLSWEVDAAFAKVTNGASAPGYGIHNLRATWTPQNGVLAGTEMRFGVENVFDTAYTPYLSTRPALGRNFKVTLARTF